MAATRGKGEGALYKQGDGLWACAVELPAGVGLDGEPKRRRKVIRGKDKGTVIRKLRELKAKVAEAGDIPTAAMGAAQWFEHWADDIAPRSKRRPSTIRGYRIALKDYVIPAVGKRRLEQLSPADVRHVHDLVMGTPKLKRWRGVPAEDLPPDVQYLSSTYALLVHNAMSAALKGALREGLVTVNVCDRVDRPQARHAPQAALDLDDAIRVLAYCATIPDGPLWATYLLTGARRGEIIGLEADRVGEDLELSWQLVRITNPDDISPSYEHRHLERTLYLTRPKSSAGWRVLPLVEPLRSIIALAQPTEGLVFTRDGAPWDPDAATDRWKEVLAGAGVLRDDVVLHGSRHTAVDLLYLAGVPEDVTRDIVGHSTIAMTRAYRTKSPAQRARLASALGALGELVSPTDGQTTVKPLPNAVNGM